MKPEERIVDAFLEEIVGGQTPPDLTEEILRRQKTGKINGNLADSDPAINESLAVKSVVSRGSDRHHEKVSRRSARGSSLTSRILVGTIAATLLLCLTASIFHFARKHDEQENNISKAVENDKSNGVAISDLPNQEKNSVDQDYEQTDQPALAEETNTPPIQPMEVDDPANSVPSPQLVEDTNHGPPLQSHEQPLPTTQLVSLIDQRLNAVWQRNGIQAATISDNQWCDRVFNVLTGRSPSASEQKQFMAVDQKDRRTVLLHRFLGDTDSNVAADDMLLDEFANKWSRNLASSFLNESIHPEDQRVDRNPATAHLLASLRYAVFHNRPYDHIAWDLLTAKGSTNPLKDDYNGAAGFLIRVTQDHSDASLAKTASRIGNGFLGQRMQCALCHNDGSLQQQTLHEFAASLRDYKVTRSRTPQIELRDASSQPLFYETTDGRLIAVAAPKTDDDQTLRESLATKILTDENFSRQAVNAVWSHVFGYGLVHPAGGFGAGNPGVDRELLERLSSQFASHDFDLRELLRWTLMSEAFSRPSVIRDADRFADRPEYNGSPLFARFYGVERKSLSPNKALKLVATAYKERGKHSLAAKLAILANVAPAMPKQNGNRIVDTSNTLPVGATIWGVSDLHAKTLEKIVASQLDRSQKIEHLFLLALHRSPTRSEQDACAKLFVGEVEETEVYQDIWWAISKR